jgi:hypothetical protein
MRGARRVCAPLTAARVRPAALRCLSRYTIPLAEFQCARVSRNDLNRITLENPSASQDQLVTFCIDALQV